MKHKFNSAANRQDIYSRVTANIIADLEKGVIPWAKPWTDGPDARIMRPLRHNGEPYAGINVLMLWIAAQEQGFSSPTWMTYKQALALGAHVRKGERGTPVVYANTITREEEGEGGELLARTIPFLKTYTVFNVTQIEGLPDDYHDEPDAAADPVERIEEAETFFAATDADIRRGGSKAYYNPTADFIRMPPIETFHDAESFYATLAHETTHWTAHPSRLDRSFDKKSWGDEGYAREELVAELGAAYLCADLGLTPVVREDHAAYIASWLRVLKDDKRAIFRAASHAQRALDYLHALQPDATEIEYAASPEFGEAEHYDDPTGEPLPAVVPNSVKPG